MRRGTVAPGNRLSGGGDARLRFGSEPADRQEAAESVRFDRTERQLQEGRVPTESGRLKVLLVDDDPLIRRGYGDRLAEAGWEVTVACDGFEAVQAARDDTYDIVLLDLRMPYRDGAEVLRTLRADPSFTSTRVFLLAQPGDADLVEQAAREGVEAVFEKARLGPRDIVAEIQARLAEPEEASADPSGAAPNRNVPSAVDEIARRFRRGHRTFSGEGPPPITADIPADVSNLIVSTPPTSPDPQPEPTPAPAPASSAGREYEPEPATGPTIAMDPMSIDVPKPSPAMLRLQARARAPQTESQPGMAPQAESQDAAEEYQAEPPRQPHPKPLSGPVDVRARTITGEVIASADAQRVSAAATGMPPAGEAGAFNCVLNRYVGEAVQLAHAMGLPSDLSCPVCDRQLALRLMLDRRRESAVHGFFYCPRCTGSDS